MSTRFRKNPSAQNRIPAIPKECLGLYVRPFDTPLYLVLSRDFLSKSKQLIGVPLTADPRDLKTTIDQLIKDNDLEDATQKSEYSVSGKKITRYVLEMDYLQQLLEALRPFSNDLLGKKSKVIPIRKGH
ncbi:hypothetical protein HY638_04735 [Candidatus Woesearchaeota archaeon]|nr:hypothetical protein [Candidatus Woesearchaeota archaeon]